MNRNTWAQRTADIHALRRARGRAAYNARRKRWAAERRRTLAWLLRQHGFDPAGNLRGAGTEVLYRRYAWETGRSRATFYRDLAYLKATGRFGAGGTGTAVGEGEGGESEARSAPPSVRPADTPPAASARADADRLSRLVRALRREPCQACGRVVGLPARTERGSPWVRSYVALRLALERMLPPGDVEAVLVYAEDVARALRPRRGGRVEAPPPPPPRPVLEPDIEQFVVRP
jgi:hypothetical protein